MLSERQLEAILEVFRQRAQAVTEEYLIRMGQHLRDIGTLSPSDINRLVELKRMNYNLEQIKREIAKAANMSLKDIEKVFEAVAESDMHFAEKMFAADHTPAIKGSLAIERILKAQAKITKQALANLSQTTILSEGYKAAVDVAVQTVQSGLTDYNSAIRRAMKAAAGDGLRVQYPNSGLTRRLDSAVRMNVLDGIRAVNQDVMRQVGKEFDADGVEISAHRLCAEDHLPYQGTQMSNKEFDRLQNTILDRPFGMWNCRHTWHPILLGISQPAYTPEELADFKQYSREEITIDGRTKTRYEWTQEQRRIETAIRQQKDIAIAAKASGDMVTRRECAYMIRQLDKYYGKITDGAGLLAKPERMRVIGFSAVKPADELKNAAERAKIAVEQKRDWLKKGYDTAIEKGDLSALTGFEHYVKVAQEIERELVGVTATDGVVIAGYKTHFIDRIIGSYEKQREPVSIANAKDALLTGQVKQNRPQNSKPSNVYRTNHCSVSVNPNNGNLIQATPRESVK